MLELRFLLVNAHFTLNLLAALVAFAVAWLYYDAWLGGKSFRESTKSIGFLFLSISFVIHATAIEQSLLTSPILGPETIAVLTVIFRMGAYLVLIFGQVIDPIQPLPSYRQISKSKLIFPIIGIPVLHFLPFLFPILAVTTAILYLRRATVGLENHLKPISWSFFALAVSELFGLAATFRDSANILIVKLTAPFEFIWYLEHLLLAISMLILGKWVWGYLIKRLETQLFMIFTTTTLTVFLITAIFFTSVSLSNLRRDTLANLEVNAHVLEYAIDSKKAEMLSDAQVIAQNPEIIAAIQEKNRKTLADLTTAVLLAKNQSILIITDQNGAVLMRADDPEKTGGSLSNDELVARALDDEVASGVTTQEGVMSPSVNIRAAVPIKSGSDLIGSVLVGTIIDNAFLDGLKSATGLDASIYADNIRSATTFIAPDGKSRWVGIREENPLIKQQVLIDNRIFSGPADILNVPYLAAFAPITNTDNQPIGMLFVGRPQISTLQAAAHLIEQTFLVTAGLLIISILPAYFISVYIIDQIRS